MSSYRDDRVWMYNRLVPSRKGLTDEFIRGVDEFIAFSLLQDTFLSNGKIRCPCSRCKNMRFHDGDDVKTHLYKYGFVPDYHQWVSQGEPYVYSTSSDQPNSQPNFQPTTNTINETSAERTSPNPYRTMVLEAAGLDHNFEFDTNNIFRDEEELPNSVASEFFELLKTTEEPLYKGCKSHTPLSVMSRLLNIKSEFNMSEVCFNRILQLVKELLPDDAKLPDDFYKTKQMIKKLGLGYTKIDVCVNECVLYYKENQDMKRCPTCGESRYKPRRNRNIKQKDIPHKVLRYFPLTPRLQRLYMSSKTSQHMTWHKRSRREPGTMSHPCDGEAWKHFDQCHPSFAVEPRNVRLALSSDGFSPYGQKGHPYSCWPVIVTPYNLPPEMCMTTPYLFLTLIIPGPKSPGRNIDLYLQPLIHELNELWHIGVETYDSSKKQNFQMRVALMWTISDFPAYGMLSGWSTHGVLSCPLCMDNSKAFFLKAGGKPTFFDCHRQFLPLNHSFRKDKKSFRKGVVEKSSAPPRISSEEVWEKVRHLPTVMENIKNDKSLGFGKHHNWTKRSIFWELPYWRTHLLRHNLDVMHIEKNVFDNIFYTVMDSKDRSKDNAKARKDMETICNRPDLELREESGKIVVPKSIYSLSKEQRKLVCEWVTKLRLPDGYASNLAKCVDMKDYSITRLKSHDCHVWLERLMPIAFKDLLDDSVWNALTELSLFFKGLCSTVLNVRNIQNLEESIVVTLCKLEKIFPPGFFDSMEHLPIHLPYEARVGGPVQYRWMYPFERFLHHLKKKVTNKAFVEGSICESYLIEETSSFCTHYFESYIQTKLTSVGRHDDGGEVDAPEGCLSIFTHPGRPSGLETVRYLSDEEFDAATIYVLLNCAEIEPFLTVFQDELIQKLPHLTPEGIESRTEKEFASWLKSYVFGDCNEVMDSRIKYLARGPFREVHTWPQYNVNGYKFHTVAYGSNKATMNSGVCIKGTSYAELESDYYGTLTDIIELEYSNPSPKRTRLVLFKCDWFDPTLNRGWRVHSRYGLADINFKRKFMKYEPFVLASQAQQVYYAEYPVKKRDKADWRAICKINARSIIDVPNLAYQEDEMCISVEPVIDDGPPHLSSRDGEERVIENHEMGITDNVLSDNVSDNVLSDNVSQTEEFDSQTEEDEGNEESGDSEDIEDE